MHFASKCHIGRLTDTAREEEDRNSNREKVSSCNRRNVTGTRGYDFDILLSALSVFLSFCSLFFSIFPCSSLGLPNYIIFLFFYVRACKTVSCVIGLTVSVYINSDCQRRLLEMVRFLISSYQISIARWPRLRIVSCN